MTTFTTRYGFPQIVEATDLVNVAVDFNTPWATLDTLLGSQVCTSTTRPASPIQGQLIFETNTGIVRIWTGTAWENTGIVACLSSAFPANPIAGDTVYTTDKNAMASYTGSAWKFTTTVVCTSTTRPAVALASGVSIWETDTLAYAEYSGSAWRYTSELTCTSSTRPTGSNVALVAGNTAYETDTTRFIIYTGSVWTQINTVNCTSSTHPANPIIGGTIFETDTNNELIYDGTAYRQTQTGAWTTYTPVWTGATTNPGGGTFTIQGKYSKTGRTCTVRVALLMATGTTLGSGAWMFSLPFTPALVAGAADTHVGTAFANNSGVAFYTGSAVVSVKLSATTVQLYSHSGGSAWASTTPAAWTVNGSYLGFTITYETTT